MYTLSELPEDEIYAGRFSPSCSAKRSRMPTYIASCLPKGRFYRVASEFVSAVLRPFANWRLRDRIERFRIGDAILTPWNAGTSGARQVTRCHRSFRYWFVKR